jgi:hypothetical protein
MVVKNLVSVNLLVLLIRALIPYINEGMPNNWYGIILDKKGKSPNYVSG